jgi:hypothetical protein
LISHRAARALGVIRKCCTPAFRSALQAELGQDWVHLPVKEIENRLWAFSE